MAVVKDILLYGTIGARPAASSANDGFFYRETDTGKTYQSDGSSWVLIADNSAISTIISDWKESVRVATTANVTLSGEQTIDAVSVVAGDRVLVKDQSTGSQNGIYVCASGAWSRSADADTSAEVTANMSLVVEAGTVNADKIFILTTNNPITLGTTALTFAVLSAGGASAFTSLSDVPASYTGHGSKIVKVKADESGLEFVSGGAGGISWSQVVNESGASFANFTAGSGTWSSDGTVIKQTNTTGNIKARFNTSIFSGIIAYEAEIQIRTSGVDKCGGLVVGYDGTTGNNSMLVRLNEGNNNINVENDAVLGIVNFSSTIDINTWYKLRINVIGDNVEIYLDGSKKGAARAGNFTNATYIGLYSNNAEVWFKNIKAWTPDLNWPA